MILKLLSHQVKLKTMRHTIFYISDQFEFKFYTYVKDSCIGQMDNAVKVYSNRIK